MRGERLEHLTQKGHIDGPTLGSFSIEPFSRSDVFRELHIDGTCHVSHDKVYQRRLEVDPEQGSHLR